MAKVVRIVDDLTGEEGAERRRFGIDDVCYGIDMTDETWQEFLDTMQMYIDRAVKIGKYTTTSRNNEPQRQEVTVSAAATRHTQEERDAVRKWAKKHGVWIRPDGGRVHTRIWHAWEKDDVTLLGPEFFVPKEEREQLMLDREAS